MLTPAHARPREEARLCALLTLHLSVLGVRPEGKVHNTCQGMEQRLRAAFCGILALDSVLTTK